MKIVRTVPSESGAYPPIQEVGGGRVPEGTALWPEELPTREFYDCGGFVMLDVRDGVVQSCTPDAGAWEAWASAHPSEPAPAAEPGEAEDLAGLVVEHEYRLTLLELGLTGGEG